MKNSELKEKDKMLVSSKKCQLSFRQIKKDVATSFQQIKEGQVVSIDDAFKEAMNGYRKNKTIFRENLP